MSNSFRDFNSLHWLRDYEKGNLIQVLKHLIKLNSVDHFSLIEVPADA